MPMQNVVFSPHGTEKFSQAAQSLHGKRVLLVCGSSYDRLSIAGALLEELKRADVDVFRFSDFSPNPEFSSVLLGVEAFRAKKCDAILTVGGGSAMDVAKCIKRYALHRGQDIAPSCEVPPNTIPLLAIPTTAGSGSEATRFAVIYHHGEKQSIAEDSLLPGHVFLIPETLDTLPEYPRKASMLDTFCHAIESYWSVNADAKSQGVSERAIGQARTAQAAYLDNQREGNRGMQEAAFAAGQAINRTQTTAAHAMAYKLTTRHRLAHGHAVALCLIPLWKHLLKNGDALLQCTLNALSRTMGFRTSEEAPRFFESLVHSLNLPALRPADAKELDLLAHSVNVQRLKNTPLALFPPQIHALYASVFETFAEQGG